MKNKNKFENTSPHPSLPPRLNFILDFSTSSLPVAHGPREWGLQSIYHVVFGSPSSSKGDSLQSSPAPVWDLPGTASGSLCQPWTSLSSRGTATSSRSALQAAGESLLCHLEQLLPFFPTDLGMCKAISLTYSFSLWLQLCSNFFPFLYMLPQ